MFIQLLSNMNGVPVLDLVIWFSGHPQRIPQRTRAPSLGEFGQCGGRVGWPEKFLRQVEFCRHLKFLTVIMWKLCLNNIKFHGEYIYICIYMYVESCWIVSTSFQVMQFFTVSWNWIYIQYIHNGVRILSVSYGLLEDEMRCPPILSLWGATWCHRRSWSGNWYPGYPSFEKPMGSYGTNHWFNQPQKDVV